ncbi:MAG: DUF2207 domain-containing protein [Brumimicrobium sp.]
MKLILTLLILFTTFLFAQTNYERITSYHSDLTIEPNCELLVKETIKVYANRNRIQRGIFRDLPLSYDYRGGNVKVGFELLEVKRDGEPEPHHTEWLSNGVRIYIGSKDVLLNPGHYTYEITYRVNNVIGIFDDFDEIYWNINGNGWAFTIQNISATVNYPESAGLVRHDGYTGAYGSTKKDFKTSVEGNSVTYKGTRPLNPEENLSIAVAWEKGHLEYPSMIESLWYWVRSYILWVIGILGLIVGLSYNTYMWFKYGRDPKPGTIIPRFYPPKGFSPAECAYLKKAGAQNDNMFGSQLVGLAVKGYITIESKKNKTYYITENDEKDRKEELNDVETRFFNLLLGGKGLLIISKKYNARVKIALLDLISSIDKKQKKVYYLRNSHLKARQYILPFIVLGLGVWAFWYFGGAFWVIVLTFVLLIIKNMIFAKLYEQPTAEGRKKMDEIEGFEMYMKYADKLRIKANNPPSMDFDYFEKNLPYAIALGVADEWKNQFDVTIIEEGYTHRMPYMYGMSLAYLSTFSQNLSTTISSASTPPASSGSGSGGGGFSGGGGGGGGGGGW